MEEVDAGGMDDDEEEEEEVVEAPKKGKGKEKAKVRFRLLGNASIGGLFADACASTPLLPFSSHRGLIPSPRKTNQHPRRRSLVPNPRRTSTRRRSRKRRKRSRLPR